MFDLSYEHICLDLPWMFGLGLIHLAILSCRDAHLVFGLETCCCYYYYYYNYIIIIIVIIIIIIIVVVVVIMDVGIRHMLECGPHIVHSMPVDFYKCMFCDTQVPLEQTTQ
jgi:hypothetical protein